jgi:hypothetical protein
LTLDRYVARLVAVPTFAAFALLILLVSAFNAALLLRDAAYSRIPFDYIAQLILLRNITAAEVLLPTYSTRYPRDVNQRHREREAFVCYAAGICRSACPAPSVCSSRHPPGGCRLLCSLASPTPRAIDSMPRPPASHRFDSRLVRWVRRDDRAVGTEIDRRASLMRGVFMQNRVKAA